MLLVLTDEHKEHLGFLPQVDSAGKYYYWHSLCYPAFRYDFTSVLAS